MADSIKGKYALDRAAESDYLMLHMGREIKLARAVSEIEPTARPMIPSIAVDDWPEGITPPEDMPHRINVVYDPAFAQFIFTLHHDPKEDGKDAAKIAKIPTDKLRKAYWRAVDASTTVFDTGKESLTELADAEREKRLILAALRDRGAGVVE